MGVNGSQVQTKSESCKNAKLLFHGQCKSSLCLKMRQQAFWSKMSESYANCVMRIAWANTRRHPYMSWNAFCCFTEP